MTAEELKNIRWFRSEPAILEFSADKIDAENGIIYDVVMVQEGDAQGHGVALEAEFISDLVSYDARHFRNTGVKARFGHPDASTSTMGQQMGTFRDVRKREKNGKMQAIGNLHLLSSANLSPTQPNMGKWVLSMAAEAPDFIMSSIVFRPGRYYQRRTDGKKRYVWEYYEVVDEDGNKQNVWANNDPKFGKVFVEFGTKGQHYYTDLVEAGAATTSLFSTEANPHFFVSKAHQFLEDNPELFSFLKNNPAAVLSFMKRLGVQPAPKKMNFRELFFGKSRPEEITELTPEEITQLREKMNEMEKSFTNLAAENKQLKSQADTSKSELDAANDRIAELSNEIAQLKKQAAELHTSGAGGEDDDAGETRSWMRDPVNQKAARMKKKTA